MVPQNIRIRFKKVGALKYISHLDLCRTMTSAIIRAKLPIWYSEGFNPRPKMVFSQPLPLFVESENEFLDIKIVEEMSCDEILNRFNSALTNDLHAYEVYIPELKLTDISYAEYAITGYENISLDKIKEMLALEELNVVKKTKSGEKEINIRPQIKSVNIENGLLKTVLDGSAISYLNPEVFCKALDLKLYDGEEIDHDIVRKEWYKEDLSIFR